MKLFSLAAAFSATLLAAPAAAQVNLTAETASPGGAVHLALSHMVEICLLYTSDAADE